MQASINTIVAVDDRYAHICDTRTHSLKQADLLSSSLAA